MNTCKLVNVWLGGNLAHALRAQNLTHGAKLECHQVVNMYLQVFSSRHYHTAIASNTSATAETVGKTAGAYIKRGKLVSRTGTEELSLDSGLWSRAEQNDRRCRPAAYQ
jgi:hypothetical protein